MAGLDDVRPPRIVTERAAKLLDARCQRVVTHCHAAPDTVQKILLGHDLRRALGQCLQH